MKNQLEVVGAAIIEDGKVLALRRKSGIAEVVHKYEFVGGKVEKGETREQALIRECEEELSLKISVKEALAEVCHEYPEFIVHLTIYRCERLSDFTLKEHEEARWMPLSELTPENWAPADADIIKKLKSKA